MNSSALPEPEHSSPTLNAAMARESAGSRFRLHWPSPAADIDARYDEALIKRAIEEGPVASLWEASRSLVVPRSYRRFERFEAVSRDFQALGWPVVVRQTGGGIVPQGPGIINFSLAYRVRGAAMRHSEPGYELICTILRNALQTLGVEAFPAAVEASFCDGRYNLAVDQDGKPVKVAGTAQMWRRIPGTPEDHIGLVHALVLLDADTTALTGLLNEFEQAAGNDRHYRAESETSIAKTAHYREGGSLHQAFTIAIADTLRHVPVPGV